MSEAKHALLSASASHRWLNCTPSVRLEETLPEEESEYAAEGSLAHEIAELKLRKYCIEPMGPRTFNSRLKKLQKNELYQEEMLKHTDTYLDYIKSVVHSFDSSPYVAAEKKLDYSSCAPEGLGTGDCIIIGGSTLHVIDFKYGKGVPVSAYENPQMKLYALGAYTEYSFIYPIASIKLTIIQPRLDSISEFELTATDLLNWGESIKPIALKAFNGEGEYKDGEHCQFCKAAGICRKQKNSNMELEQYNFAEPPIISNEEVGQILERAQNLAKWVKKLEAYALAECLKGNDIPGWKAVHGRSTRQFTDIDAAFNVLKANGTDESMLYERKALALTEVESLIGKSNFKELLSGFVNAPPGKPTLSKISDKREAIKNLSAKEIFSDQGGNV
ncbi:DUF2800 domain-containing protein [Clostridium sp. 19966]|uniref:DUF2800 domain-containing protein n=1 Tax=Clostridium sp. 19966 TaxID=2768166 RepID=UPI0028DDE34A|nr:DUF2800 domain-containing protein [Clostridium sp. 19966]MDT8715464.1 DUF2800 domain-containing protein [Clostridium sp. 19966]